jgi:hypothetical protein
MVKKEQVYYECCVVWCCVVEEVIVTSYSFTPELDERVSYIKA